MDIRIGVQKMDFKELITYILTAASLVIMLYVRFSYQKRQRTSGHIELYSEKEKKLRQLAFSLAVTAIVLYLI